MPEASYEQIKKIKLLWKAWAKVRSNAIQSSSLETRSEAIEFDSEADSHIRSLSQKLNHKTFKFEKGTAIPIPKGPGKLGIRPIVREPIVNRIVKRALLEILKDDVKFSSFFSQSNSFGAIPKKSVAIAWREVLSAVNDGYTEYIRSDIKAFFDSVSKKHLSDKFKSLIEDDDLRDILNMAMIVELENLSEIESVKFYFPLEDKGIAQGSSLSPLLANIALSDFDKNVQDKSSRTFRYVDDFLILSSSPREASKAYRRARKILSNLDLTVYDPDVDHAKASRGNVQNGLEFLGIQFSPGFLMPSEKARKKLKGNIQDIFDGSRKKLNKGGIKNYKKYSYSATLNHVSNVLAGWGNQYSFCNHYQTFKEIDRWIDRQIAEYWFWISEKSSECTDEKKRLKLQRRLLGVHLLSDSKKEPIIGAECKLG